MNSKIISKRSDPAVRQIRDLKKERSRIFLEGPKLIAEAVQSGLSIELLIVQGEVVPDIPAREIVRITAEVMEFIAETDNPQGVAALAARPRWTWGDLIPRVPRPMVLLDGIQNPGNAASIVRTAAASDAAGIIALEGTASLFGPKALRGAMGATFRFPILERIAPQEIEVQLSPHGYKLLVANAHEGTSYRDIDWNKPWALLLGSEGQGPKTHWQAVSQEIVHIPMAAGTESLNVGAAAAVLLLESFHNRQQAAGSRQP